MKYGDKLKKPKWQKKRLEILQRDDFTCQLCKDKEETLHVHHKSYEWGKEPWDYDNDNFVTYCEMCHRLVEEFKDVYDFRIVIKIDEGDLIQFLCMEHDGSYVFLNYTKDTDQLVALVKMEPKEIEVLVDFYNKHKKPENYELNIVFKPVADVQEVH